MDINIGETLFIIVGAAISISVGELVSWFLVYRNADYKDLVSRIETAVTKYNKEKESFVKETNAKNQEKRLAQIESQIKGLNYEMTFKKMISNAAVAILSIVTINSIGNYYSGIVVAKLAFEPFWILQQITHRGLNGEDLTDCSYIFIYILSALIFKSNIQKYSVWKDLKCHLVLEVLNLVCSNSEIDALQYYQLTLFNCCYYSISALQIEYFYYLIIQSKLQRLMSKEEYQKQEDAPDANAQPTLGQVQQQIKRKNKKRAILNPQQSTGHWSEEEHKTYINFLNVHRSVMESSDQKPLKYLNS